ncbi:MAG TPA: nuclear transport factor 2 family protein [Pyrinomonadaceae bacterium]|nr:nuclear transport factor 2 family protein [Pyrinomonadaceae bacterium]
MKSILVLLMLVVSMPAVTQGQAKKVNRRLAVERELRKLVRLWDDADVKRDTATLARLLADEFTFVGGPTKREYLDSLRSLSPDSFTESAISTDVRVQVYGSTVIVTGVDTIAGKNKGQPYVNKWLYMDVWIKRAGRWQCVKTYSTLAKS